MVIERGMRARGGSVSTMICEAEFSPLDEDDIAFALTLAHPVAEADIPALNTFGEAQTRLLVDSLTASWNPECPFVVLAKPALYFAVRAKPSVPAVLVSVDATLPTHLPCAIPDGYLPWVYGKAPDIVVDVIADRVEEELDRKIRAYAFHGVPFYVVYDPEERVQHPALHSYQRMPSQSAAPHLPMAFPATGLGIVEWEGEFMGLHSRWVRWIDATGCLLPTSEERACALLKPEAFA